MKFGDVGDAPDQVGQCGRSRCVGRYVPRATVLIRRRVWCVIRPAEVHIEPPNSGGWRERPMRLGRRIRHRPARAAPDRSDLAAGGLRDGACGLFRLRRCLPRGGTARGRATARPCASGRVRHPRRLRRGPACTRTAGLNAREARARVLGPGGLEYAVLAPAAALAAAILLARGARHPSLGFTLPWAIAVPLGFVAAFGALTFRHRVGEGKMASCAPARARRRSHAEEACCAGSRTSGSVRRHDALLGRRRRLPVGVPPCLS